MTMVTDDSSGCDGSASDSSSSAVDLSLRSNPAAAQNSYYHGKNHKKREKSLGRNETRAVRTLRLMTLVVLLAAAFLCSYGIYGVASDSEKEAFELEYYSQVDKVIESFHTSVEEFLGSFDALSASITSYARDSGSVFPNVTISDFDVRGGSARILAKGTFIQYMPLVTDETRKGWEAYSTANQGHLIPTFMHEQQLKTIQDIKYGYTTPSEQQQQQQQSQQQQQDNATPVVGNGTESKDGSTRHQRNTRKLQLESIGVQSFREEIWGTTGIGETEAEGTGPYLPIWHVSPALPLINLLNMNSLDLLFFNGPYTQALNKGQASLGLMTHLDDPTDENGESIKVLNALLSQGQYRHELEMYTRDPITSIAYPVFDNFTPQRQVVGILGSALYWRLLFKNVLPESGRDILNVVIRNSFGQAATYRVTGANVEFVGDGDLHDPNYDSMEQSANIADYVASRAGPNSRSYTAVDLNSNYVSYEIHVFPTEEMEAVFVTNRPLHYAIGAVSIFFFTAVVFLLYNYLVEHRQKIILDKAIKSSAVVDSLFPANIQQRLYEETEDHAEKSTSRSSTNNNNGATKAKHNKDSKKKEWNNNGGAAVAAEGNLIRFLSASSMGGGSSSMLLTSERSAHQPIADFFPEATVFFADIVGFTKWSSNRTPGEVFGLLEGIYGAFDSIAARRKVFKIETIGDCYVAVTGIPEPQADHAVTMAKFAAECLVKLRHILLKLMDKFGQETLDLNMRIGIHSGPVTAGVLRGERARFQLFGDTVNTAARMESNGSPGRIHCSQETADYLLKDNRNSWLKLREGTIHAKGKGEMQTYWIEPSKPKTNATIDGGGEHGSGKSPPSSSRTTASV